MGLNTITLVADHLGVTAPKCSGIITVDMISSLQITMALRLQVTYVSAANDYSELREPLYPLPLIHREAQLP